MYKCGKKKQKKIYKKKIFILWLFQQTNKHWLWSIFMISFIPWNSLRRNFEWQTYFSTLNTFILTEIGVLFQKKRSAIYQIAEIINELCSSSMKRWFSAVIKLMTNVNKIQFVWLTEREEEKNVIDSSIPIPVRILWMIRFVRYNSIGLRIWFV